MIHSQFRRKSAQVLGVRPSELGPFGRYEPEDKRTGADDAERSDAEVGPEPASETCRSRSGRGCRGPLPARQRTARMGFLGIVVPMSKTASPPLDRPNTPMRSPYARMSLEMVERPADVLERAWPEAPAARLAARRRRS